MHCSLDQYRNGPDAGTCPSPSRQPIMFTPRSLLLAHDALRLWTYGVWAFWISNPALITPSNGRMPVSYRSRLCAGAWESPHVRNSSDPTSLAESKVPVHQRSIITTNSSLFPFILHPIQLFKAVFTTLLIYSIHRAPQWPPPKFISYTHLIIALYLAYTPKFFKVKMLFNTVAATLLGLSTLAAAGTSHLF